MMDFDYATKRLAQDQKKIRGRKPVVVSDKAKREAEYRKKQQAKLKAERERKEKQQKYQIQYVTDCERKLGLKSLSNNNNSNNNFTATSIHGDGDKIALPPSVLENLTSSMATNNTGNPWTFRIGLLNPDYKFPSSPLIQRLTPTDEEEYFDHDADDNIDDESNNEQAAYLDELSYKYIAYTHSTVVEFTQEESHVGIPHPIATALLDNKRQRNGNKINVPMKRTVDPAKAQNSEEELNDNQMEIDGDSEKTPGHIAWGAFDIPDMPLEVSLVKLPKGKACTLVPTKEAVKNGFYGLKDVKLVLEQSLIRTRATLTVGDVVHTWHRGVKFDLNVTKVSPSSFGAVTCINTDIEVDIGEVEQQDDKPTTNDNNTFVPSSNNTNQNQQQSQSSPPTTTTTIANGGGYTLAGGLQQPSSTVASSVPPQPLPVAPVESLLPEPAEGQSGVCTIQIRSSAGTGKRRFDINQARVMDLFAFAASVAGTTTLSSFRLVANFPRRVIAMDANNSSSLLSQAGLNEGREALMVEMI